MRLLLSRLVCAIFCALLGTAWAGGPMDWKPVDPADLALKSARVDKDADAEAIFWEVWVSDEMQGDSLRTVLSNYIRVKVFTDHGRETQSTRDLQFYGKTRIGDIAGRTIKPDGTIVELKKDAVYERTIVKAGGLKVKAKSFAMPGVEPGSIIEYRWREFRDDQVSNYIRLQFQRDIPVETVIYHIKPLSVSWLPYGMRSVGFHSRNTPFVQDKGLSGYFMTRMTDVPAFKEEAYMPPEDQLRAWMLVFYAEDKKISPEKFWLEHGKDLYKTYKGKMKVNDEVRRTADQIVGDAKTPAEKLSRLYRYCQTKLKREDTVYDHGRAKEDKSPGDILKQGAGTHREIDMTFGALATAAGLDARYARLSDRSDIFFDASFPDDYFLRTYDIAVQVDGKWRFYDPASRSVPPGMLSWYEEGTAALVSDSKELVLLTTPLSPPESSREKRKGTFTLAEDGTLEGDVEMAYTGHPGIVLRSSAEKQTPAEREEALKETVTRYLSTAEVSDMKIENVDDTEKPLVYRYHVKVPSYAQRTGKRIFVPLSYFEFNYPAKFTTAKRVHPIYFKYPWMEEDSVTVALPVGYELDHPEAPGSFPIASVGRYDVKVVLTTDNKLVYTRTFVFGNNSNILFPIEAYPQLKKIFDMVHEQDAQTVALKQTALKVSDAH